MPDRILKEAFAKIKAIEESAFDDQYGNTTDRGPNAPKSKPIERVPGSEYDRMMTNLERSKKKKRTVKEEDVNDMHDKAIDLLDDMLAAHEDPYGQEADVLRYAITRLQEVGRGR